MTRSLLVKNKAFSMTGAMVFDDLNGSSQFSAKKAFAFLKTKWVLLDGNNEVAIITKPAFSSKQIIKLGQDSFTLKKKALSFRMKHKITGGSLDGCIVDGGYWDETFKILKGNDVIASGRNKLISSRDACKIDIYSDDLLPQLITVIVAMRFDSQFNEKSEI